MSLRDAFRALVGSTPSGPTYRDVTYTDSTRRLILGLSPEELWRTQPHLRTVVSFVARNVAQLGLHTFERVSESDRRRERTDPVAQTLSRPNPTMTQHELMYATVSDYKLYDVAVWLVVESADAVSGWEIYQISPGWVKATGGGTAWAPAWIDVQRPGQPQPERVFAKDFLLFHGWNPGHPGSWSSPVDALRGVLAEQIHANAYRQQVWTRGGRVGAVLKRPAGSPDWSDAARERFARDWKSKWTGDDGPKAGGTPILEDGMELQRLGFSAKEDDWVEGAKLSLATVAQVYHVNPTMIGQLENANFSNVREFRRMLYGETLGPDLAFFEDRINTFLIPRLTARTDLYVEFNIAEKLQGSFEEQADTFSKSTGAPYMLRSEARARLNLPEIDGADDLVVPLNVLTGGQASPQDGVTEGRGGGELVPTGPAPLTGDDLKLRVDAVNALIRSGFDPAESLAAMGLDPILHLGLLPVTVQRPVEPENVDQEAVDALKEIPGRWLVKARAAAPYAAKCEQVLAAFFDRQERVVLAALGAKAPGWWDEARWDRELADDLFALALTITPAVAKDVLDGLGFGPDAYSVGQTEKFLKAVAKSRAGAINSTTRDRIKAALVADEPDVAAVFAEAKSARVPAGAQTLVTTFSAFATTEAAKQSTGDRATKTWVVASRNPRASHAAMNGETVGIDDVFSNGMNWPGDPAGGADEVAGCMCGVEINVP